MKITVKQVNETIATKGFVVNKEGSKYILKKDKTKWQLKGTLKANYNTILKLAGVQGEMFETPELSDEVKQLFKYAFDVMWGDKNADELKMIHFKETKLNGVENKLNAKYRQYSTDEKPFYRIWKGILKYLFINEKSDCDTLLKKFESEMDMEQLIRLV